MSVCACSFDTALFNTVENNCGYHLFESDSEEEEEDVPEKTEEEQPPKKKSAFQVRARMIWAKTKNKGDTVKVFHNFPLKCSFWIL